jgi:metal-responsive CopG/Arc/MetJ family transcriptional regulator
MLYSDVSICYTWLMRTTLDIPAGLLAELKAVVPAQPRSAAVRLALAEFIRQRKREKLRQLRGRLRIKDVSHAMEAAELADAKRHR